MFVLPSCCRVSPVEVSFYDGKSGPSLQPDAKLRLICMMGSSFGSPDVSIASESIVPFRDGSLTLCEFPGIDIPLSRKILENSTLFSIVVVLCGVYDKPLWVSDLMSLSDQSYRLFRQYSFKPRQAGLPLATATFRLELLPSGSIVPQLVDARTPHQCPYCLPNKPRRRVCVACSSEGRLICTSCNGDSKMSCPDCEGRGYASFAVAAVTSFASAVPVLTRQQCRTCAGSRTVSCPLCDGLGEVRCDTCGGAGDLRCPCSVSKLEEDQFI